ncbi:MAG: class B sortase [Lachnospiraceae bacterium]|nr:class B sortase [Lachnospiraceae bacterium]
MDKYTIGDYEFETEEEWADAVDDLQTIRQIINTTDVHNPDEALALYRMMREGELTFKGPVGEAFFHDIADTVAEFSEQSLMKDKEEVKEDPLSIKSLIGRIFFKNNRSGVKNDAENAEIVLKKKTRSQWIYLVVGALCIVAAILCFLYYAYSEYTEMLKTRALEQTSQKKSITEAVNWYLSKRDSGEFSDAEIHEISTEDNSSYFGQNSVTTEAQEIEAEPEEKTILPEYTTLHDQYPNLAGWLSIADTSIDLPVMQSDDNDYYLHVNMDGEDDTNGTLFLDYRTDVLEPGANSIIYGHNMRSGEMFGGLKQYLDEGYARNHETIEFDTIYEKQTFKVVCVCLSHVGYQDEDAYKYYNFTDAANEAEFKAFTDAMDEAAAVRLREDPVWGDRLLTLSTCNSYTEDGRLYLVAVKVNE